MASEPSNGFSFINVYGAPGTVDPSVTRSIKAHVMRRYRTQQRLERKLKGHGSERGAAPKKRILYYPEIFARANRKEREACVCQEPTLHVGVESRSDFAPATLSACDIKSAPQRDEASLKISEGRDIDLRNGAMQFLEQQSVLNILDGGLNPYEVLPIPASPRVLMLLHYNTSLCIRTSVHADPTGRYPSYCIEDAAWLFMTLSFSAARCHLQTGFDQAESTYYLAKSISMVNKNLSDSSRQVADSTIATVACLTNMEASSPLNPPSNENEPYLPPCHRAESQRNHLKCSHPYERPAKDGRNEGRARQSGDGRHPAQDGNLVFAAGADLCNAARSQTTPRFPLLLFENLLSLSQCSPLKSPKCYELAPGKSLTAAAIAQGHSGALQILQSLHELSVFLNIMGPDQQALPANAAYPDRVYGVEHRILTQLAHQAPDSNAVFGPLLHAGLLYIYTNLRQTPVGGEIRQALVARLKTSLMVPDALLPAELYPAELLWASMLGGFAALDPSHRACAVDEDLRCTTQTSGPGNRRGNEDEQEVESGSSKLEAESTQGVARRKDAWYKSKFSANHFSYYNATHYRSI
ncbi:hypothetical protein BP5796_01999 [Coleophoma crateriformis]|uniref:Uncharacterized protein n=1 Tax=Coleophoma crateriformis TaxID=565419 RepID=A0A3D8T211_9HELO|nr:hypothetical protein BP5796_01999 [Coleophoma crateriformis]